jgi:hypothetical protein
MSAILGLNPISYYSWKDQVFYQISSFIKENKNVSSTLGIHQLMKPMPLKLYRREIASSSPQLSYSGCSNRISQSIDLFNMPGSTIVSENLTCKNGLVNFIDNQVTECKSTNCNINMPDVDARRRVRSAGMIRKKYDPTKNNSSYFTDRNQYLVSRNRTFTQNQYNYIRQGDSTAVPGTALSSANVYSPQGISHCQKYQMGASSFSYTWIDGKTYVVSIPGGYYAVEDINAIFKEAMITNYHYFIVTPNNSTTFVGTQLVKLEAYIGLKNIAFLMNIGFNSNTNRVELQVTEADSTRFNTSIVTLPTFPSLALDWSASFNLIAKVPSFVIDNAIFSLATGFSLGSYGGGTTDKTFTSSFAPGRPFQWGSPCPGRRAPP